MLRLIHMPQVHNPLRVHTVLSVLVNYEMFYSSHWQLQSNLGSLVAEQVSHSQMKLIHVS